jgi:hypothetical protein
MCLCSKFLTNFLSYLIFTHNRSYFYLSNKPRLPKSIPCTRSRDADTATFAHYTFGSRTTSRTYTVYLGCNIQRVDWLLNKLGPAKEDLVLFEPWFFALWYSVATLWGTVLPVTPGLDAVWLLVLHWWLKSYEKANSSISYRWWSSH